MSSYTTHNEAPHAGTMAGVGRTVAAGAAAGVVVSLVMAMYAMTAAITYQNSGFFTTPYQIGSVFVDPSAMMTSMQQAMAGSNFYFAFGPAIVGGAVHMMVGAVYGIVFAIIARAAKLHGITLVIAGMVYGVTIFAVSAWIGLPLAAAISSSGDQIDDMAAMGGYGTFLLAHRAPRRRYRTCTGRRHILAIEGEQL